LKRSNRLILLIGVFLAIVAFVGIVIIVGNPSQPGGQQQAVTHDNTIIAAADIPLGTTITQEMLGEQDLPVAQRAAGAYNNKGLVIGKIARTKIAKDAQITPEMFTARGGGSACAPEDIQLADTSHRAMAVQVDQVSGVGTVIRTGDYVDAVVGFTADKFPVVTLNPDDNTVSVVSGLNATSVKLLLQGMQVLCTLLPAPTTTTTTQEGQPAPSQGEQGTALNQQQEIVILEVSAQQSEVIKFAQMDGSVTLTLRSPAEFRDAKTGQPISAPPAETTGVSLKLLVDEYNVLIPQLVETVLPAQRR
jgi:Flp pilus assembly protein CpaB